jgi:VIT1/CCC1 family predicted Fe2+/Mn2+ transporter
VAGTDEDVSLAHRLGLDRDRVAARVVDLNDGVIASAGIVEGFSAAGVTGPSIVLAAVAAMVAGGIALGGAKYAEAAAEHEVQQAILDEEQRLLELSPDEELAELRGLYEAKGLSPALADQVARELSDRDPLAAHADAEYGITEQDLLVAPLRTGVAAGLSFAVGAVLPLGVILLSPPAWQGLVTFLAVMVALGLTSLLIARFGRTRLRRTVFRTLVVGVLAMGVSWLGGHLFE